MQDLPTGTLTLVFTDIEGSTRLLREQGSAYPELLAGHRRTVREIFGARAGFEVDTQGDAFFFAFSRASDALAAAEAVQRALDGGPVRVRIGVHTGEPELTDEGYVGIDLHIAARVCAAAHGGQILLTSGTKALVEIDLRDLGLQRLRDVEAPVRLYQLGTGEFPPPRTFDATNLPHPASPLLGRDADLEAVTRLLSRERVRLVTITGPGGIGKTRLAIDVAAAHASNFEDGIWFVDLAPIREPDLVVPTLGAAVSAKGDVADFLRHKRLLAVLDNFEQVTAAAPEIADLLEAASELTLLVTSREPLHIQAEHEYSLPPLAEEASVELFRSRAQAVRSDFDAEFTELAEISRRLEGLPLAIELAAARARILDAAELIEKLGQRLTLLSAGARDAPARHKTLRATIDWSYDLLPDQERRVFARLATFVGGFTLEAAEDVCDSDFETVALLVDKNLVRRSDGRFMLLETLREYAAEHLADSGEQADLEKRHALYFLALAQRAEPEFTGQEQAVWIERVAREHENLRVALERLRQDGDKESVLRLSSALVFFWFLRGFYAEGIEWLGRAIASSERRSQALAKALWGAGFLEVLSGDYESGEAHLTEGLAVARELDDGSSVARTLLVLGLLAFFRNEIAGARSAMEESVEIARGVDDTWCLVDGLGTLSSIYPLQGDLEKAERFGQESLRLAHHRNDQQGRRMALFGLALTAVRRNDHVRARELASEGLDLSREIGDPWFISYFLWLLSMAAYERGELAQARVEIDEALAVGREVGGALLVVCALEVLARLDLADTDLDAARGHLDEALEVASTGVPMSYTAAVHLTRSKLAFELGDAESARRELERSLDLARECGDTWAENAALAARASLES